MDVGVKVNRCERDFVQILEVCFCLVEEHSYQNISDVVPMMTHNGQTLLIREKVSTVLKIYLRP